MCEEGEKKKTLKSAPCGVEPAWEERSVTNFLLLDVQLQEEISPFVIPGGPPIPTHAHAANNELREKRSSVHARSNRACT